MADLNNAEQERLFREARRVSIEARSDGNLLRERAANTAAWLLSYSPTSQVARDWPLFYDLMLYHGKGLMDGLRERTP